VTAGRRAGRRGDDKVGTDGVVTVRSLDLETYLISEVSASKGLISAYFINDFDAQGACRGALVCCTATRSVAARPLPLWRRCRGGNR
jgi:hypothetical protein